MIIRQLTILFFISFLSEIISNCLPFTFPASLMAMIILFILFGISITLIAFEIGLIIYKKIKSPFAPRLFYL